VDTIIIVDDHADVRARVRAMLEAEGFEVVGEAAGVASALAAVARLNPAVALVDVGLPDGDGFELASRIALGAAGRQHRGSTAVVLTSSREASVYRARLAAAPVAGFIAKDELSGAAIRAVIAAPPNDEGAP
jgi:DNA-binding NarL/FixJ family response regulator